MQPLPGRLHWLPQAPSSLWAPTCSLVGFSDLPGRWQRWTSHPAWINVLRNDWVSESCPDHLAGSLDFSQLWWSSRQNSRSAQQGCWLCWQWELPWSRELAGGSLAGWPNCPEEAWSQRKQLHMQLTQQAPAACRGRNRQHWGFWVMVCVAVNLDRSLSFTEPQSSYLQMDVLVTSSCRIAEG